MCDVGTVESDGSFDWNNMSSGAENTWKSKSLSEEARYVREKEQAQLAALKDQTGKEETKVNEIQKDQDFEGGFGGQEDLEDRYATTSGEH